MSDKKSEYVVCPYCGAHITLLAFRMVEAQEEKFSEKKILEMNLEIERIRDELDTNRRLDSAQKIIYRNKIEHIELQLKDPIIRYKERVYICPECEKVLSIMPENMFKQAIELLTSSTFDIRDLT